MDMGSVECVDWALVGVGAVSAICLVVVSLRVCCLRPSCDEDDEDPPPPWLRLLFWRLSVEVLEAVCIVERGPPLLKPNIISCYINDYIARAFLKSRRLRHEEGLVLSREGDDCGLWRVFLSELELALPLVLE